MKITRYWGYSGGFLEHEIMAERICFHCEKQKNNVIDDIPLKEQYLLFSGLMKLFEVYPDNLLSFCRLHGLRFTDLSRDMSPLPFWYAEIVNDFDQGRKGFTIEEVRSAAAFLKKRNGWTCKEHVSQMIGHCLDSRKRRDVKKYFAEQIAVGSSLSCRVIRAIDAALRVNSYRSDEKGNFNRVSGPEVDMSH